MKRVNNYVRVGYHPQITIFTFDDRNQAEVEEVKKHVSAILSNSHSRMPVALWKPCPSMDYPRVGELNRTVWS